MFKVAFSNISISLSLATPLSISGNRRRVLLDTVLTVCQLALSFLAALAVFMSSTLQCRIFSCLWNCVELRDRLCFSPLSISQSSRKSIVHSRQPQTQLQFCNRILWHYWAAASFSALCPLSPGPIIFLCKRGSCSSGSCSGSKKVFYLELPASSVPFVNPSVCERKRMDFCFI